MSEVSTSDTVVLYDWPRAPSCQQVRIALALKGVAHETVPVDIWAGTRDEAWFRALNPQGLLPVLRIDGLVLTQSLAIIEYLEETRNGMPLLPRAATARAHVRRLAQDIATASGPLTNFGVTSDIQHRFGRAAAQGWIMEQFSSSLIRLEQCLTEAKSGDFSCGDSPSMADCVLAPHLNSAWRWGIEPRATPRLNSIFERCLSLRQFRENLWAGAV